MEYKVYNDDELIKVMTSSYDLISYLQQNPKKEFKIIPFNPDEINIDESDKDITEKTPLEVLETMEIEVKELMSLYDDTITDEYQSRINELKDIMLKTRVL